MLIHHGSESYDVAASAAAKEARGKFEAQIEHGRSRATAVIEKIENEVPTDAVVKGTSIEFSVSNKGIQAALAGKLVSKFHRHAIGQAAAKAGIPTTYIDRLMGMGEWGQALVAENLNQLYHNGDNAGSRYLIRSVNGEVRGFLSNSYRRMDSRPILQAFIEAVQKYSAVPLDGFATDTQVQLQVVLPHIFEPVPNEVMVIGAAFGNSDFGQGAVSVRTFLNRLWCTNRAIGSEDLRKIHLGARLGEDIQFSQRTYELDTRTMASAVGDIVNHTMSPENVNKFLAGVRAANEEKVEARGMMAFLKKYLRKDEVKETVDAFNSPEIEMLPAGQTKWRMSNAISWIANTKVEDEGRKLQLMRVAGAVIDGGKLVMDEEVDEVAA